MRINLLLFFAFLTTLISTTLFALSTVIGEAFLKYLISSFIEKEVQAEYRITNLEFDDNLSISFGVNIENRDIASFRGYIDINNLEIVLNYSINRAESKWFKRFGDFGKFSASGNININIFEGRFTSKFATQRDRLYFKYRKKFLRNERYLDIYRSYISMESLRVLTNIEFFDDGIILTGSLAGNSRQLSGKVEIKSENEKFGLYGDIVYQYRNGKIVIVGNSPKLGGDVNISITNQESDIHLHQVKLEKVVRLFNFDYKFQSVGDMNLTYLRDRIEFSGFSDSVKIVQDRYLQYINRLFGINLEKSGFRDFQFSGYIKNGFIYFNSDIYNQNIQFVIENGNYNTFRKDIEWTAITYIDGNKLFTIHSDTFTGDFSISPTDIGLDKLKQSIYYNSQYYDEVTNLINLY